MVHLPATVDVADYFVAWFKNVSAAFGLGIIGSRPYVQYKPFWLGWSTMFAINSSVPACKFLEYFLPGMVHVTPFVRFFSGWSGLIYVFIFLSAIPSILAFLKRKRIDDEGLKDDKAERHLDAQSVNNLLQEVMSTTKASQDRFQDRRNASHASHNAA